MENTTSNPNPRKALIVGAGVSGLAAAWQLSRLRPWWKIVVVEQAEEIGGLAATWDVAGRRVDLGPHRWYTELSEMKSLEPKLLPESEIITRPRCSQMFLQGKVIDYPPRLANLVKNFGLLNVARLGASAVVERLAPNLDPPVNFAQAMRRKYGECACEWISDPYGRKVWKTDPELLSPEIARVRAGNDSKSGWFKPDALTNISYIRGGIDGIPKHMASLCEEQGIKIIRNHKLDSLTTDEDSKLVLTGLMTDLESGTQLETEFDVLISTMPLTKLAKMLPAFHEDYTAVKACKRLKFLGMILVAVELSKPRYSQNTWIYYPDENLMFNRSYEPGNFDPSQAREDSTLVVFDITSRADREPWMLDNNEILDIVYKQLTESSLVAADDVISMHLLRVPFAYPLYGKGYEHDLQPVMEKVSHYNNLVSTGRQGLFYHNNMDHSIIMGIRAAECISENDNAGPVWNREYVPSFSNYRIVD